MHVAAGQVASVQVVNHQPKLGTPARAFSRHHIYCASYPPLPKWPNSPSLHHWTPDYNRATAATRPIPELKSLVGPWIPNYSLLTAYFQNISPPQFVIQRQNRPPHPTPFFAIPPTRYRQLRIQHVAHHTRSTRSAHVLRCLYLPCPTHGPRPARVSPTLASSPHVTCCRPHPQPTRPSIRTCTHVDTSSPTKASALAALSTATTQLPSLRTPQPRQEWLLPRQLPASHPRQAELAESLLYGVVAHGSGSHVEGRYVRILALLVGRGAEPCRFH